MDWTMTEGYGIPIGSSFAHGAPEEVSLVSFTLHLSAFTRKQLYRRLQQAYASGSLHLVKRIHALLALAQGQSVGDVAAMLSLGEQTVRDYRNQYLCKGMASLVYKASPGRPSKLTKTQRQQLAEWIKASPQDIGYTAGCWNTSMIQDLLQRHFGVAYHPPYIATLLKNMGFRIRKPVLSPITSMRPNASSGVTPDGPRFSARPSSARPCCSLAMRPVLPSGAR